MVGIPVNLLRCFMPSDVLNPSPDHHPSADHENRDAFARHQARVLGCDRCPDVFGPPVTGFVPGARVFLMGQAPGPKERDAGVPFIWTAGRTLFKWFGAIGVTEQDFRQKAYMGAVIRCFPGKIPGQSGDRKPSRQEAERCGEFFLQELELLRPELVVAVGRMAIDRLIEFNKLDDVVGRVLPVTYQGHQFRCVPLPHPSGLSRWIQKPEGKARITQALDALTREPAWRETFPGCHTPAKGMI